MIWLVKGAGDDDGLLSHDAVALLCGVAREDVEKAFNSLSPEGIAMVDVPPEWLKSGRRRRGEAAARTGSNWVVDTLAYWARKDLGAEIVEIDGEVFLK